MKILKQVNRGCMQKVKLARLHLNNTFWQKDRTYNNKKDTVVRKKIRQWKGNRNFLSPFK